MKPQSPRACCVRQIGQARLGGRPKPILPKLPRQPVSPVVRPFVPAKRPGL